MKCAIIDIATLEDDFGNRTFKVTLEFLEPPLFHLGMADLKQKGVNEDERVSDKTGGSDIRQ